MTGERFQPPDRPTPSLIRDVYDMSVELVDHQLGVFELPDVDEEAQARLEVQHARALSHEVDETQTARFNVLEMPTPGSCPPPYSAVLEKTPIIAFQTVGGSGKFPLTRKIELLDPLRAFFEGGPTLLMAVLQDGGGQDGSQLPAVQLHNNAENLEDWLPPRPFDELELTHNLMHLIVTIKKMSEAGKLRPLSMADIQGMYLHAKDLGNL